MRKLFYILIICSWIFPISGSAMVFDPAQQSYLFHLYYDNGSLAINRDSKLSYEITYESFQEQRDLATNAYKGIVVSMADQTLQEFRFDPKDGNDNFTQGPIDVAAPYFANAKLVKFYNNNNVLLLTEDVGEVSVCNQDKICQSDHGENSAVCPSDCKGPTNTNVPEPSQNSTTNSLIWIFNIMAVVVIIIIIAAFIVVRRLRRKRKEDDQEKNNP